MNKIITTIFKNQAFMIKKAWNFSKLFFFCKFLIAFLNGVMPAVNALFSKFLIEKLAEKNWTGAIVIIVVMTITLNYSRMAD